MVTAVVDRDLLKPVVAEIEGPSSHVKRGIDSHPPEIPDLPAHGTRVTNELELGSEREVADPGESSGNSEIEVGATLGPTVTGRNETLVLEVGLDIADLSRDPQLGRVEVIAAVVRRADDVEGILRGYGESTDVEAVPHVDGIAFVAQLAVGEIRILQGETEPDVGAELAVASRHVMDGLTAIVDLEARVDRHAAADLVGAREAEVGGRGDGHEPEQERDREDGTGVDGHGGLLCTIHWRGRCVCVTFNFYEDLMLI